MFSILTNKHFLIAMLIAPILAVITWFAIGKVAGPQPQAAKIGSSYPLIAKPNCRYESGQCTLVNNDFRIDILPVITENNGGTWLTIESDFPIEGTRISLLDQDGETFMTADASSFGESNRSGILLPRALSDIANIRLALNSSGVFYYAETQTKFLKDYE